MTVHPTHPPEEEPEKPSPNATERTPGAEEIARLTTLVAQLALMVEDTQQLGNRGAYYNLQVQYHQASAALLAKVQTLDPKAGPRTEALRRRHEERAQEFQVLLDQLDE